MVGLVFLGDVHITMFFRLPLEGAGQYHDMKIGHSPQVSIRIVGISADVSHRVVL